jgi:hypothetical protein
MVDTLCPFPKDTLRTSYAIHRIAWKGNSQKLVGVLASWHHAL